jgi:hypothetical protein
MATASDPLWKWIFKCSNLPIKQLIELNELRQIRFRLGVVSIVTCRDNFKKKQTLLQANWKIVFAAHSWETPEKFDVFVTVIDGVRLGCSELDLLEDFPSRETSQTKLWAEKSQ